MAAKRLSTIDRIGVSVVVCIGTVIGAGIAVASDLRLTPLPLMLFPGLVAGILAFKLFGMVAGVVACAISNGFVYGLALYCWMRLLNALTGVLPLWLGALGARLSRRSTST